MHEPIAADPIVVERIAALDWQRVAASLDAEGHAVMHSMLSPEECASLAAGYAVDEQFRSRVVMARHGYGRGEYKYFAYPLPELIAGLRTALYPRLCGIANRWNETMSIAVRYPDDHAEFLDRCHRAGQTRPTPLLLQYGEGDYNCLHQDLYGEHVFPLQVAFLLSKPETGFHGRRIRAHGTAAPHAIARHGRAAGSGKRRRLRGEQSTRARHARQLSRQAASRRKPGSRRPAPYARHHFSRCGVKGRTQNSGNNGETDAVLSFTFLLSPESYVLSPSSAAMSADATIAARDSGVSRLIRPSVPLR